MDNRKDKIYVMGMFTVDYVTINPIPDERMDAFYEFLKKRAFELQEGSSHTAYFTGKGTELIEVIFDIKKIDVPINLNQFNEEYILSASVWIKDGKKHVHQPRNINSGFVVSGRRHHNCFATIQSVYRFVDNIDEEDTNIFIDDSNVEMVQGFITSKDRFLNRREAYELAVSVGQCEKRNSTLTNILISEDIY